MTSSLSTLLRNVKNLKKLTLGKNRGNEMNLIDMLLGRDIEFVMEVVKSNKKLFLTQEAKKLVKKRKYDEPSYLCIFDKIEIDLKNIKLSLAVSY